MARPVAICTDDYGLSPGIDRAIRDLAARGRITAVSCMTTGADWPAAAGALIGGGSDIDIGLHLDLIGDRALTALIAKTHLGLAPRDECRRAIETQFDAFAVATGRMPDHVDGHLHVHVLPGIRDIVAEVTRRRAPRAWIRNTSEPWPRIRRRGVATGKSFVVAMLGRTRFARGNDGFSGIYDFGGDRDYGALFDRFVGNLGPRPLIVCHPCDDGDDPAPHAAARLAEYRFFGSEDFMAAVRRHDLAPTRLSRLF
jgi:hypothetical protein